MSNDNYNRVRELFVAKREKAEAAAIYKKNEVYRRIPELQKIDAKLSATGLKVMQALKNNSDNIEEIIKDIREENLKLQKNKARLLLENGYPEDYTDIKYECSACSDNGYIGLKMCECFKKELNRENYYSSGIGKALQDKTFESFNLNYVTGKDENGISPRENMKRNLEFCRAFSKAAATTDENLMLLGGTGLGKTHLSAAIAREAIDNGCAVYYDGMINILNLLQKNDSSADKLFNCTLLIMDDFGTEYLNEMRASLVYNLLNTRLINGKPMLISTNLNSEELKKKYDSRILSRLFGEFKILRFYGQDVRSIKLMNKTNGKIEE